MQKQATQKSKRGKPFGSWEAEPVFWSNVEKGNFEKCWPWLRSRTKAGYGQFVFRGNRFMAHRFAWFLTVGFLQPAKYICHKCDNPWCCNPTHLFEATPKENTADMWAKGRANRKPRTDLRKISRKQADNIRKIYPGVPWGLKNKVAERFGISTAALHQIIHRKTYND